MMCFPPHLCLQGQVLKYNLVREMSGRCHAHSVLRHWYYSWGSREMIIEKRITTGTFVTLLKV
jgi:hypothetical protein